jgi:glutamate dehydrogenase/leucine dehydrogenase
MSRPKTDRASDVFKNAPQILQLQEDSSDFVGWLAIDSLINNRCWGGLRMLPALSAQELAELAKAMTLKFGFLGLPHGGAKAGIICEQDCSPEKKRILLATFARHIREALVKRVFSPASDMGTTNQDIRYLFDSLHLPLSKRAYRSERSGWYTSLTVIASAQVIADYAKIDLSQSTAAIQGFGRVGASVAAGVHRLGCKVVAISTVKSALYNPKGLHVDKLLTLHRQYGDNFIAYYQEADFIPKETLLTLDVDCLFPCARGYCVTMENVSQIKAKVISSGANLPITEDAEKELFQRGVICAPDFITNCGGILGGTMNFAGIDDKNIERFIHRYFYKQVSLMMDQSFKLNRYPRPIATEIAMRRFARVKSIVEKTNLAGKAFQLAIEQFRNGLIPESLVAVLAQRYFLKRIQGQF